MDSFHSDAVYAMLMANVFKPPHGLQLDEIYDLKGSTYKREALKPGQEAKRGE